MKYPVSVDQAYASFQFYLTPMPGSIRTFQAEGVVPSDLKCFQGHFSDDPVLPAYAIIEVTIESLRKVLGNPSLELKEIRSAKFQKPVHPGQKVLMTLSERAESQWCAEWSSGDPATPPAASIVFRLG
jgi:3-hydroxymyristoyl/3-hydroxydecanoyl-(acyl carrier protein) dehydratase